MKANVSQILVTVSALETIIVPEQIICCQVCTVFNLLTTTMTLLGEDILVTAVTVTVAVPY
jgi:hypothetical protein